MAVNLVTVTGSLESLSGTTPSLGRVWFRLNRPDWNLNGDIFAPEYVEAIADPASGAFSKALQTTDDLEAGASYSVILKYREPLDNKDREYTVANFMLPDGGPYQLGDLLTVPFIEPVPADILALCQAYAVAAGTAADAAQAWAESPTPPDPLDPTSKSSKSWAGEAEAKAASILGLTATANTLSPAAPATAAYNPGTGVMTFGIPQGIQGIQGIQGDAGADAVIVKATTPEAEAGTGTGIMDATLTAAAIAAQGAGAAWASQITGGVARNVDSKISEGVSVLDFGAVGDGVANSTAAFTAARDYIVSTGKIVVVPPGTYLVDPLTLNATSYANQGCFVGTDRDKCVIKRRSNAGTPFFTVGSASGTIFQSGINFSNLTFDGGIATNGPAFTAYDLVRTTLDRCRFTGGSAACRLFGGISLNFTNCLFEKATIGLHITKFTSSAGGGWPNLINLRGGEIVDNTNCGVYFDDGRVLSIDGVDIEGNGTTLGTSLGGLYVGSGIGAEVTVSDPGSIGVVVKNCWFEANKGVSNAYFGSGMNSISDSNFFSTEFQVTNDVKIDGGKYQLENLNLSFAKTANILEGSGVGEGNLISRVDGAAFTYNAKKTVVIHGAAIYMRDGAVPSIISSVKPVMQMAIDTTGVNPTITFPTSFKLGTTPHVVGQALNNSAGTLSAPEIYDVTNTGFKCRKNYHNGTTLTTINYALQWIAIGEALDP